LFKKSLMILVMLDFVLVFAFVLSFGRYQSFAPVYIGILPLVLCNFIYAREFISPKPDAEAKASTGQPVKKLNVFSLLMLPVWFCLTLPALIKFNSSLGWSPVISLGFSLLLCLVIIATYAGAKSAIK
jgi:hypothetical protein